MPVRPAWALTFALALLGAPPLPAADLPDGNVRPVLRPPITAATSFHLDSRAAAERARILLEGGQSAGLERDLTAFRIRPSLPATGATGASGPEVAAIKTSEPIARTADPDPGPRNGAPRLVPQQDSPRPDPAKFGATSHYLRPFAEEREALLAAVETAGPQEAAARRLDYVQFLTAHMMVPEAQSILGALRDGPTLDPASQDRALGYAAILSRLAGQSPAASLPPIWRDDPLWSVLLAPPPETGEPGGADLRAALKALPHQSRHVATALLPDLFDRALMRGEVGVAAEILAAAPARTDLEGTAGLDLMRGRLALAQGGEEMAFDIFARLSEGLGQAAAKARLAMAEMALSRDDPALLPEIRALLLGGLSDWRGDAAALRLRVQLASVAEQIDDVPTAIEVMALILQEHPDTPEADLADARLGVVLGLFANQLHSGEMPLDAAVATVRRLDPLMVGRGDWIAVRARLAERLIDANLLQAAQAEYANIAALPPATLRQAEAHVLDAAASRQARLLLAQGDSKGALAALDRRLVPRSADLLVPVAGLRVAASGTSDFPKRFLAALGVADPGDITDPAVQIGLAKAAREAGDIPAALAAYDSAIGIASVPERLEAAHLAGEARDHARATRYVGLLPGERGRRQGDVVARLAAIEPLSGPLSVDTAETIITGAEATGTAINALLGQED